MAWFGDTQVELPWSPPIHTAIGPVAGLPIVNAMVSPDGFTRSAVVAGHSLLGPVISGQKGDNFQINITNYLTDDTMLTGTTIHWHSITQHNHSQMDGSAYVTQCPITPGNSFLYNFTSGSQTGTFWYHSHYRVQYCDGLCGPLIIYNPDDPYRLNYDVDDETTIITLMDWYHIPTPQVVKQTPDSLLINGVGCYNDKCENPHAILMVQPGKRYRFRHLNMVDGNYVEPYTVDSIPIFAAQRYSFILNADQHIDNYWVHVIPEQATKANTQVILRYIEAPPQLPSERPTLNHNPMNETLLRPLISPSARLLQPEPDMKINTMTFGKHKKDYLLNGVMYTPPSVPILMQIMSEAIKPWQVEPQGSIYTLPKDKVIEISFYPKDFPGQPHPFHLHGHHFAVTVIKTVNGQFRNYDKPVVRDTVSTEKAEDEVIIWFLTDNAGPWMLHCHNEWHLYAGMAVVFMEDFDGIMHDQPLEDATRATCPFSGPPQNLHLPPPDS